ncbi:hypothetical protein [Hyphomicrobium sp. D-2]|uniref:hypothetical protein n=1 Tax=Hyphomicrobium sp. D-2 TaxID=3041621 RepID=UPI0024582416|nr:hypothetical protein [Hyphomicrobium sp. D-2]MDH4981463.1 hypothetical protein [Hyphomicrobium sp. D-2]
MALGTIAGAIASAGVSAAAQKLLGGKKAEPNVVATNPFALPEVQSTLNRLSNPTVAGFSGGGLTGSFANGQASVTADPTRSGIVNNIAGQFGLQLERLNALATQIAPGYSNMRTQVLGDLENQQKSAIGDLRQNLANRRVLGSSFAQDALTRANATFANQRSQASADLFMKELETTHALITEQTQAGVNQFQTHLTEANLEAGIAGQLATEASNVMNQAAQIQAQLVASLAGQYTTASTTASVKNADLAAQSATGTGTFWSTLAQPVAGAVGGEITNLFDRK